MKTAKEIYILGLDMSRAFDTIDRQKLLNELREIIDEDSWRMVKSLLENTNLQARIGQTLSKPFNTDIGAPQGDLSKPLIYSTSNTYIIKAKILISIVCLLVASP